MKKPTRGFAVLGGLLALGLALAGCAPASDSSESSTGGTLVIDKSFDLATADPARQFEVTGIILGRALYDTLLTFADGDSSTPIPMIATKVEGNADATVYTFTLRDDVKFSNGDPLTADDVVYSLNRVANIKGNGSFLMAGLTAAKVDDTHVTITSATPNTAIPSIVTAPTLGIVDSKLVTANGGSDAPGADTADKAQAFLDKTSAGSGPYTLESFSTTTETVIVANPKYWGPKPRYDRVVIRNATAATQLQDVTSGTAQIALDLGSDQVAPLKSNPDLAVQTTASPNVFFLFNNASAAVSSVTSNPKFQEAVTYGLDYDSLLELAGDGAARAEGVIPNSYLGALKAGEGVKRDVARAKAAVAALGTIPPITLEYASDLSVNGVDFGPVAERIQANLAEVGITINLAPGPVATTLANYRSGAEQMGLWYWGPDYPDPSDYLVFGPGASVGLRAGWAAGSNPDIESIASKAAVTVADSDRAPLYEDFQKKLNEAGVFHPLFQPAATVVATKATGKVLYSPAYGLDIVNVGK